MNRQIIPYNPRLKQRAKWLRNNSTKSEVMLWKFLKGKQILGFDFHRQRPIDNYIVDFFCHEIYLAIELDGYTHLFESSEKRDLRKENRLNELGIKVIRFWDSEVFNDIDNVLRVIEITVEKRRVKFEI